MFVEKWMTRDPVTVAPDATIASVAIEMNQRRFRHFPVVETTRGGAGLRSNLLVGIITESDIFDAFLSMTAARNQGVRVMVASDSGTNPVPAVLELSRRNKVDLLSLFSFQENRLKRTEMSIFRFGGRLPSGFLQEIAALGFRIVSVQHKER